MNVVGSYRAGHSPLHRMSPLSKVLALLAWGIVAAVFSDPVTSVGMSAAALMLLISTMPRLWPTVRGLVFIAVIAALAALYQVYRGAYGSAVDIAADLVGLFALSIAVTSSTPMGDLLDLATSAARPFRRIIPPAIPGIMFALIVRAIPEVASIMRQSRDAARARGAQWSLRAHVVPTAVRTAGFALDLGAALHARGIGDEAREDPVFVRSGRASRRAAAR